LDALAPCQEQIEDTRSGVLRRQTVPAPTVVLYEVTSSYVEGECHALAACGYNRDKKAGKPQIVMGLVTTGPGGRIRLHG
jgi:transposase